MSERVKLAYQSTGKKGATSEQYLHDIRLIARHFGVYAKGADIYSDYFNTVIQRVKRENYYYGTRMEVLGFRCERARRREQESVKAVA